MNKTSRICSKCPKLRILVSTETKQALEDGSNNFVFNQTTINMKGIGQEPAFVVFKRMKQHRSKFKSNINRGSEQANKGVSNASPSFGGSRGINTSEISGNLGEVGNTTSS